ncbi:MAG: oleate hydratase [Bacteroidota bacterium]
MDSKNSSRVIRQLSGSYSNEDDIAIIGGGASGMASAYFLIEAGHNPQKITIYERNTYLGGHARSLYLHRVSKNELYVIQDYEMAFENEYKDIFLQFKDHNNTDQRIKVNDNPDVIPVDIGVCGFSKNYRNFKNVLSDLKNDEGIPFFELKYLEEVNRAIHLRNLVLRSDKPMYGQLWRPWNWLRLFRLKKDVKKIVDYYEEKGMSYLRTVSVRAVLTELKDRSVSQDGLDLLCAFCQVGSGYSNAQFAEISGAYLFNFFMLGNFNNAGENNTIFLYGVSAYLHKLVTYLKEAGVQFKRENKAAAKHTIYAIQPYDARKLNKALPEITSTKSILYVHCDNFFQGKAGTILSYGKVNGIALATWDLDQMRPQHPDVGAFITFSIPDHESAMEERLYKNDDVLLLRETMGNGHNLYNGPLKKVWQHAFIDVPAEAIRREIWQNHQGKDGVYYCSSSYLDCMLHENAYTSALDVACMITGAQAKLAEGGFRPSGFSLEIYGE